MLSSAWWAKNFKTLYVTLCLISVIKCPTVLPGLWYSYSHFIQSKKKFFKNNQIYKLRKFINKDKELNYNQEYFRVDWSINFRRKQIKTLKAAHCVPSSNNYS